jgi:hypothetical protein
MSQMTRLASLLTLSRPTARYWGEAPQNARAVHARLIFGLKWTCGPRAVTCPQPDRVASRRSSSTRPLDSPIATRSSREESGHHAKHWMEIEMTAS